MSAAWREGEPVDVWRAFRRLHFETDWEQLTGEQADEAVLRALETGDVWQPKLIQPGGTAAVDGCPPGRGARKASALHRRARRRARQAAARGAGPGGGGPALAPRPPGRRRRRHDRRADPRDRQAPVPGPDPRLPDVDLLGARPQPASSRSSWLEEIDQVLAGAPATVEDVRRLPYVHRVLLETMRLYPPAFGIFREALQDLDIDGHLVPAGDYVVMSQWVTHRDPRLWDDPLRFDPDRWAEGATRPRGHGLLPVLGRPARLPRLAAGAARGDARGGHGQPALAPEGRDRQGTRDDAGHRAAAEEAAPAHSGGALLGRLPV